MTPRLPLLLTLLAAHLAQPALSGIVSTDGHWHAETIAGELIIASLPDGREHHRRALMPQSGERSATAALLAHQNPHGVLLALEGAAELWFIALDEDAGPFHQGFVHSYIAGMEESLASESGLFARQRIMLEAPLIRLQDEPDEIYILQGIRTDGTCVRIHLIAKREIGPCPEDPSQ
ncbi:hypothetical protein [Celeribacter neptunius]|uniref:hypothetical protein n=1 Tax=Celeribacter neptunius TaxID=588602 RepID=UPI001160DCE9|nr:hypothetical protein [Celeribacter neptunius]